MLRNEPLDVSDFLFLHSIERFILLNSESLEKENFSKESNGSFPGINLSCAWLGVQMYIGQGCDN